MPLGFNVKMEPNTSSQDLKQPVQSQVTTERAKRQSLVLKKAVTEENEENMGVNNHRMTIHKIENYYKLLFN